MLIKLYLFIFVIFFMSSEEEGNIPDAFESSGCAKHGLKGTTEHKTREGQVFDMLSIAIIIFVRKNPSSATGIYFIFQIYIAFLVYISLRPIQLDLECLHR